MDRWIKGRTGRWRKRQGSGQTEKQTDKQIGRQADRQTERERQTG